MTVGVAESAQELIHQFSNPHSETARALIVLTPDIGAQYFRDVGSIVNAGGPPDRAKLFGVMAKYGLVPAPQGAAAAQPVAADGAPRRR